MTEDETTKALVDAAQRLVWRSEAVLCGVEGDEGRERLDSLADAVRVYKAAWMPYNREHPPGPGIIETNRRARAEHDVVGGRDL